ncbi:hypothetical protein D6774_02770 [Candidatus Woesearchaeota archaeon]|nr:MAG: hypothetical protein D6774_02770 [Candidatus Woesearchaeota archaeon]
MLISLVFAVQGVYMHQQVTSKEAQFHAEQNEYFAEHTKAERDSAAAGSELALQQARIANTPSELLRLKLVGIGKILTGIYVLLFAILVALVMMPKRLAKVLHK